MRAQLSLEETFACGVGGCWGCVVPLAGDSAQAPSFPPASQDGSDVVYARVCEEGPSFGRTSCDGRTAADRSERSHREAAACLSDVHGQRMLRQRRGVCAVRRSRAHRRGRAQERHAASAAWGIRRRVSCTHRPGCSTQSGCRIRASSGISSMTSQSSRRGRARSSGALPDFRSTITRTRANVSPHATRSTRSKSTSRAPTSQAKARRSPAIPGSRRKSCAQCARRRTRR